MSECLKMFKFIIAQSSNIRRPEHSYRWKYGTNNLKYDIILFQKKPKHIKNTTPLCRICDDISFASSKHACQISDDISVEKPMN